MKDDKPSTPGLPVRPGPHWELGRKVTFVSGAVKGSDRAAALAFAREGTSEDWIALSRG